MTNKQFVIPMVEANLDIHRFMAKYFLDGLGGKPDPKKTLKPITLYSFLKNEWKARAAFEFIPELHVSHARDCFHKYTFVGWDLNKVFHQVPKIEGERAQEEARQECYWLFRPIHSELYGKIWK